MRHQRLGEKASLHIQAFEVLKDYLLRNLPTGFIGAPLNKKQQPRIYKHVREVTHTMQERERLRELLSSLRVLTLPVLPKPSG
jgi:hypothetical protein